MIPSYLKHIQNVWFLIIELNAPTDSSRLICNNYWERFAAEIFVVPLVRSALLSKLWLPATLFVNICYNICQYLSQYTICFPSLQCAEQIMASQLKYLSIVVTTQYLLQHLSIFFSAIFITKSVTICVTIFFTTLGNICYNICYNIL